ncbi:MAG: hypothetical protein OXC26_06025 [Albidovulum sp.]|nr:hypothetical protein [Albidovulum sp.]
MSSSKELASFSAALGMMLGSVQYLGYGAVHGLGIHVERCLGFCDVQTLGFGDLWFRRNEKHWFRFRSYVQAAKKGH